MNLYKNAVLKCNMAKYNLKKGDIVTITDYVEGEKEIPNAYIVEAVNALGETIAVFPVRTNKIALLTDKDIFHVRTFKKSIFR